MRLPLLAPSNLNERRRSIYDSAREVADPTCKPVAGAYMKARPQVFGQAQLPADAGVSAATLAVGQRATGLAIEEGVAFEVASALNAGGPIAESAREEGLG